MLPWSRTARAHPGRRPTIWVSCGMRCRSSTTCPMAASGPPWSTAAVCASHTAVTGSVHCPTGARTRADPSARARSRTVCCAAHGTATTTTRSTGRPPSGFSACAGGVPGAAQSTTVVEVALAPVAPHRPRRSPMSWSTRCWRGGSPTSSAWSDTPTSGSPTRMRRAEERGDLTYIGIRHEGAAAFAASAFGKLTGRPGVCFAIAGPGSTNLLTGLYDAKIDQAPGGRHLGSGARPECSVGARSRIWTWPPRSPTLRCGPATVLPTSDHAELGDPGVQARHGRARGRPPRSCPTRCRSRPRPECPAGGPSGRVRRPRRWHRRSVPLDDALDLDRDGPSGRCSSSGHGARAGIDGVIVDLAERL